MSATTASLSTAEKARRKAEARRLRILAKGKQRFDVVNGLAPSDVIKNDTPPVTPVASSPTAADDDDDVIQPMVETVDSTDIISVNSSDERKAKAAERMEATSLSAEGGTQSKGARRMAAMRKRRYQSKNKPAAMADKNEDGKDAEIAVEEEKVVEKSEPSGANNENDEPTEEEKKVPESPLSIATEKDDKENISSPTNSVPTSPTTAAPDEARDEVDEPQKKYMGVARMRRKRIKEQKAQRLKEIADAEVLSGTPSKSGSVDIQRELVAEIATMDITASMVRKGGLVDGVGGGRISKGNSLSGIAMKKYGRKWWSVLIPPMKLVPRIVTLVLLFFAGLDLGMQPHRAAPSPFGNDVVARDLAGVPNVESLIQHVEPSLTKPWEYGLGGKVAYAVGMAPSSPPTALPTSFVIGSLDCVAENVGTEECVAPKNKVNRDNTGSKKKSSIKMQLMEDEFDSSRTRPKGVDRHNNNADDASEFDDVDATMNKAPNIDPLFQVDLDSLLETASLPLPIDYAAKFAIGFHRTWMYYLWTLPTSIMKSLFSVPKNVFTGWIENPPWILGVVLTIRLLTRIVVGNGKSLAFSLDNSEDNSESSSGGGNDNNLDVLGKGIDMAKNYVTSKFPKAVLIGGTLMQVMKVDMYVVLCGLLIGLVLPSIKKEDYLTWGNSREGTSRPVLGDGEL